MASGMREHSVGGISEGLSFSLSSMSIGMEASSVPYTELSIACQGLKDRDWTSVSDPFAILSEMRSNGIFVERDRTEVIWNDLNPKFCKKFQFEDDDVDKRFQLTFMDFDHLKGDDFLGSLQFTLREVVSAGAHKLTFGLKNKKGKDGKRNGVLHMYPERLIRTEQQYTVGVELGIGPDCKIDGKRKVFVSLSRSTPDGMDYVRIYCSESVKPPKSPEAFVFPTFDVDSSTLTAQDSKRFLLLEIYMEGRNGSHKLVGEATFRVGKLDNLRAGESVPFFSGISADGRGRPKLVFPCMNWNIGGNSGVIVMRVSNLWI